MRKLILGMFVSIDGFVSGPNGEADWIFKSGDSATDEWVVANLRSTGLLAMGRRSFEQMAPYWPTADTAFAAPMNEIPKLVFTRKGLGDTPDAGAEIGSWANPFVAGADLAGDVARLKAQPGKDIRTLGGAEFARELAASGLIDEYHLLMCPVALGQGKPLFSALSAPRDLRLISSKTFDTGAVALVYHAA